MHMHKFLWLLIVLVFSVVGCDGRSATPTPLPPPNSTTPPPVNDTSTPALLPDLTIKDVNIEPAPTVSADGRQLLFRGITYTFSVNVINIGDGPARVASVDAPYGCQGQGLAPNNLFAGNDLAPGESHLSNSFSVTIRTDRGGNCTFKFIVDPDNVYAESDESSSSNTREVTFEVP